ncbi:G-patch domain and KOW motifs-containing protein isoform X4 [Rhinopithecus roxellana]|uniref:G-patch domain and KOW motifs-containing protein isoform X4 n=1 Tax=Rhinopithecus roxellana TaxID=61622 RepID=UPI0005336418|nr:G-patch domain and KOW motifs-containing protein isoform X4 [Rhinopithecus roxellana]XP_017716684.1 PREDICTED: G patch domain and KOW motifs-containing protein isoform X2 [Rhinopithecus bieti]
MADSEEGVLPLTAASTAPISFSFTRMSARRRLADSRDGARPSPEEKDFLKTVEGRELQSVKPQEAPKELVIPLIQNGHRRQPPARPPGPSTDTEALADGVLSQAVKELIEESKKSLEERENAGVDPTLAIPMIQKGCTPSGEGADSEPRAETVPEEANYEAVPVEAYGLAMLRGMGWKPGEGIGRTFNQVVKPCVNSLRPKGLGLGANLTEAQALTPTGPSYMPRPDEEQEKDKEDQLQGLVPGGAVVVLSGPHRGLYGKVEGLDPDNVRAMVRLAVGSRVVTVRQQNGTASSRKTVRNQELHVQQDNSERKRKHLPDRLDGPAAKSEKAAPRSQHWLHRDLRVRFVDKMYKGGQYYNTKMIIEDVLSPDSCVCRTDEGRVLEGLREDMLETLVPKAEGDRVMVVLGPQAGRVGHLLSRDRARSRALVQLPRENQVVELHYDAICQYMGPSDTDDD